MSRRGFIAGWIEEGESGEAVVERVRDDGRFGVAPKTEVGDDIGGEPELAVVQILCHER